MPQECDVLRDEGEAYARKLIQAGVHVTALRYLGTIHDFVMLNAITNTPAARSAIEQANGALRNVFTKQAKIIRTAVRTANNVEAAGGRGIPLGPLLSPFRAV
jgi:hypothetical protein